MIIEWLKTKIGYKTTKTLIIIWYIVMVLLILTFIMLPQGRIKYLDW